MYILLTCMFVTISYRSSIRKKINVDSKSVFFFNPLIWRGKLEPSPKYHESCLIRRQGKARSAHVQFHKSLLIITFFIKFLDILLKTAINFV